MSIQNKVYKWPSCSPRVPEGRAGELRLTAASCDWNTTQHVADVVVVAVVVVVVVVVVVAAVLVFATVADSGGVIWLGRPFPQPARLYKTTSHWRILFCFLPDYITVVAYNLQNITSFWRTCPPDLLAGLCPWTPMKDFHPGTPWWTSLLPKSWMCSCATVGRPSTVAYYPGI